MLDPYKLVLATSNLADMVGGRRSPRAASQKMQGHPPTLLSDEAVLECRSRFEFGHETKQQLARVYGVPLNYMARLLNYQTRSRLIPSRKQWKASKEASTKSLLMPPQISRPSGDGKEGAA